MIDGILDTTEVRDLHASIRKLPFTRSQFSVADAADVLHWAAHVKLADAKRTGYYELILAELQRASPKRRHKLYSVYINSNAYGDMLYPHRDGAKPDDVSVLLFANAVWKPEWGGELVFFDDERDAIGCVSPRPGRLVMFPGTMFHTGTPPSRVCYEPRLTFVFKFTTRRD